MIMIGTKKVLLILIYGAVLALSVTLFAACPKQSATGDSAGEAVQTSQGGVETADAGASDGTSTDRAETSDGEQVDKGVSDMFPDESAPDDSTTPGGERWKPLKLTSTAFQDKGAISPRYSRKSNNLNPPLKIDGVPSHAKSLVIIMDDPDAPGGVWTHWVLFNIPATTSAIGEMEVIPGARHGLNSWGQDKYDGPQPPSGTHRYQFKLYALDNTLGLQAGATRSQVEQAMTGHVIATAVLTGTFSAG